MFIIAGNWKMNGSLSFTDEMISYIKGIAEDKKDRVKTIIFPPFVYLHYAVDKAKDTTINVGAQNMYIKEKGAYTGEISPLFLKDIGVNYVIVGHSERRNYFNESSEFVAEKAKVALEHGIIPVVCIGEKLEEREEGKTFEIIENQLTPLFNLLKYDIKNIIIAYEPVWAIGTGRTATPDQAQEVHEYIRRSLKSVVGDESINIPILYGGSVKESNVKDLLKEKDIDGALIGGASLKKEEFSNIINIASETEA